MNTWLPKVSFAIRIVGAGVMIRFAYDETGPWTVAILILLVLGVESLTAIWRRIARKLDPKEW